MVALWRKRDNPDLIALNWTMSDFAVRKATNQLIWRLHMRKLALLFSVILLGASWVAAQDNSTSQDQANSPAASQTASSTAGSETTVQGCLSGSDGNFTLTDKSGNNYTLTGDTAKLTEHVGHEVKVTGTTSSASTSPSGGGSATGTTGQATAGSATTIEINSVKHISKTCQSGAASQ